MEKKRMIRDAETVGARSPARHPKAGKGRSCGHDFSDSDMIMVKKIHEIAAKAKLTKAKKVVEMAPQAETPESNHTPIKWPGDKQIREISQRLLQIKKLGIRYEEKGDYFNSGELAYQIQEMIRLAHELLNKSLRVSQRIA